MMVTMTIATTIAIALLNIRDDKKDADHLTTNTNCTHETGSLIAEFASQGPNYSSATQVLAYPIFQHHCDQLSALFQDFFSINVQFENFSGPDFSFFIFQEFA